MQLAACDIETPVELVEEQASSGRIGLKPFAVNHQLRNGPLAHVPQHFVRRGGIAVHIDLGVFDAVRVEKLLGLPAIPAPVARVNLHVHRIILPAGWVIASVTMTTAMSAAEIKKLLGLEPHPMEGGSFRRTYTSPGIVELERGIRRQATAIYYLLEPATFSEMHVLDSDEIFHFYLGDPVEMLQLWPDGDSVRVTLGPDLQKGHQVQLVVPAGVWQGTRLVGDGKVALLGCTVTPGFDFADYRGGCYEELAAKWPAEAVRIRELTRR